MESENNINEESTKKRTSGRPKKIKPIEEDMTN